MANVHWLNSRITSYNVCYTKLLRRYIDVVAEVRVFLEQQIERCVTAGIARERLVLDPGFGFGKSLQHNLQLLKHMDTLLALGFPLLVGTSRKSMVGQALDRPVDP